MRAGAAPALCSAGRASLHPTRRSVDAPAPLLRPPPPAGAAAAAAGSGETAGAAAAAGAGGAETTGTTGRGSGRLRIMSGSGTRAAAGTGSAAAARGTGASGAGSSWGWGRICWAGWAVAGWLWLQQGCLSRLGCRRPCNTTVEPAGLVLVRSPVLPDAQRRHARTTGEHWRRSSSRGSALGADSTGSTAVDGAAG
jgi:hypothetical protein